jgi:nucleobase transporter 1/2
METGSSSEPLGKAERVKGSGAATRHGSVPSKIEPFVPRFGHNPRELKSWAKKTGFVSDYSWGTETSASEKNDSSGFDLEKGIDLRNGGSSPKIEIDPVLGRTKPNRGIEIEPVVRNERDGTVRGENQRRRTRDEPNDDERRVRLNGNGSGNGNLNVNVNGIVNRNANGNEVPAVAPVAEPKKEDGGVAERDAKIDVYPNEEEPAHGGWGRPSGMKCGLRDNPGFG